MEGAERDSRSAIPRRSRLPVPRAALTTSTHSTQDNVQQAASEIPKLLDSRISKVPKVAHRASTNHSESQPESTVEGQTFPQNASSLEQLQVVHAESLHDGYSNSSVNCDKIPFPKTPDGLKEKRKPRPSLSERTMETLSQVTPSPSPSRRRTGNIDSINSMAPPFRLPATLRLSNSNGNLRARQVSPFKQSQQLSSHKDLPTSEEMMESSSRYLGMLTPSKSTPKASSIPAAKSREGTNYADNTVIPKLQKSTSNLSSVSAPSRVKSLQSLRPPSSKSTVPRSSLVTNSQNESKQASHPIALSDQRKPNHIASKKALLSKRPTPSIGLSSVSSPPKVLVTTGDAKSFEKLSHNTLSSKVSADANVPQSSLTLRETIARAKAAKREKMSKEPALNGQNFEDLTLSKQPDLVSDNRQGPSSSKTLQKRIDSAVTSGILSIAALSLKSLPEAIQSMYNFNQESMVNWAEAVDLIKFSAADNELVDIPEPFFPDWSEEELQESEDKMNQFGGLQTLDFRDNRLRTIPLGFRRLSQLQVLFLTNNQLELDALDVIYQISHLKELHLANNKIEGAIPSFPAAMASLEILDLHSNRIHMLPESVSRMKSLQKLDLSDNCLDIIPMEGLHDLPLIELNLSKNSLSGILFKAGLKNAKLQTLNVASNRFTSLCDSELDLPKLHTLICDDNHLRSLPSLTKLGSLVTLRASGNKIESLPLGFTEGEKMHIVDLGGNQIRVLDPLIGRMDNLANLNIAANPLRDRKFLAMRTDQVKTELTKRLNIEEQETGSALTTGSEQLSVTMPPASNASKRNIQPANGVLDLSSNNLKSIDLDVIDFHQAIHTVILTHNNLVTFPEKLLVHPMVKSTLRCLDISYNKSLHPTHYLAFQVFLPSLECLRISGSGLHSLEGLFAHLSVPVLKELNVSSQRISGALPSFRKTFPCLTTLYAADNCFSSIDVEAIRGLEVVDIRNNNIESLPAKIGELGNVEPNKAVAGRLRAFECSGNKFRVPRMAVIERGTEAVLRDLRRMVPSDQIGSEWRE